MNVQRIYRNWDSDDCHIYVRMGISKRIVPFFNPHFSPHLHDELEIQYIIRGSYELYRTEGNIRVGADTIYIVPPNEPHGQRSLSQDGEYIILVIQTSAISMDREHFFQKGFVEPLRTGRLHLPRLFRPNDPGYKELEGYMQQLRQLYIDDPTCISKRFIYAMSFCMELMQYCSVTQRNTYARRAESTIAKTCVEYLHEHYAEKISLEKLAEYVHVHPNYLCAAFKKDTGQTVLEHLNKIRVEQAKIYLGKTDLSVSQVGERCGFQSISAFQRTFKAYTGTTPGKFTRNFRMNQASTKTGDVK